MSLEQSVDDQVLEDLRLLVSELVTNSVRHAGARPEAGVGLDVELSDARLRVEVSDAGTGFEPRARIAGQAQDSGWGLFLVDQIADRWGVARTNGTTVWFEIDDAASNGGSTRLL